MRDVFFNVYLFVLFLPCVMDGSVYPRNSYVEVLTPATPQNVTVFGDSTFKEVIKVK